MFLTKPLGQPAVDSLGCGIIGRVGGVDGDPVLQRPDHQALLPGFPSYALHGPEDGRMVGENEVGLLLQSLLHDLLRQVVGQEECLHSMGRARLHQQPHVVPTLSKGEGCKVVQGGKESLQIHEGVRRTADPGRGKPDARRDQLYRGQHTETR